MKIKRLLLLLLPFVASALLLSVIQAPTDWSFFAWVALVPFALGCAPRIRARSVFLAAYAVAIVYWLANLYWLAPITVAGWVVMGFYIGLLWPLLALAVRFCRSRRIPLFVALPVLLVGVERFQGFPLGGFYWRLLGHSQYANLTVIQIADIFGAAGVSFLVALVNGALAEAAIRLRISDCGLRIGAAALIRNLKSAIRNPTVITVAVLALMAVGGTVLYGQWRLRQTPDCATEGPMVGSLQSNVPQSVKGSHEASQDIFDELMTSHQAAQAAGAELVVWPETMVQGMLDPLLWSRLPEWDWSEDKAFHEALSEAAQGKVYILVGAHGGEILRDFQGELYLGQYNSAYLYRPDGTLAADRYDKIHLVLFGEYIPFRRKFNWLYQQLKRFAPEEYNYDYSLEHGTHYTVFEIDPNEVSSVKSQVSSGDSELQTSTLTLQTPYHFGVIICYEDTIPYVARNFALDENGRKRVDWLVNISNDGWFVRFPQEPARVLPSTELPQHAAICVFRAVENRLPILRSVNTGISCLIDSTGRIRDDYLASSRDFPVDAMERTGMSGWFLDRMPIDRRVTFFSRHGQWLDNACAVVFVGVLAAPVALRIARRGGGKSARKAKV
ncbi:MAG: apolipoprotein N-acyltransferase [Sedimentisphaerales bacterium]|nr:apolipoprotein N-acyltransferase [Sedimentisphaerales bacterium]